MRKVSGLTGRCDQNIANTFNGYVTYDLPFGRGSLPTT
jgi:hypothetical protein